MKRFVALCQILEQSTDTEKQVSALVSYFSQISDTDKLWAIALLTNRRPKRIVTLSVLKEWAIEAAELPVWLFEESYKLVGDLSETIAKIVSSPHGSSSTSKVKTKSLTEWLDTIRVIQKCEAGTIKQGVLVAWNELEAGERYIYNKIITGGFRMRVPQKLMARALGEILNHKPYSVALQLQKIDRISEWHPSITSYNKLFSIDESETELVKPYPLAKAHTLDVAVATLGNPNCWTAQYRWEGFRVQLIKKGAQLYLWSAAEELLTDQFPELAPLSMVHFDFVIDGELLKVNDMDNGLETINQRIKRQKVSKKELKDSDITLNALDLMKIDDSDLSNTSYLERREVLEKLLHSLGNPAIVGLTAFLEFGSWDELAKFRTRARAQNSVGITLVEKTATYNIHEELNDKAITLHQRYNWDIEKLVITTVLLYAHVAQRRGARKYDEFTFAVINKDKLIPIAKVTAQLSEAEIKEISLFVKNNTFEKFGPVRSVMPELIFEISYNGLKLSKRKKAGITLKEPRILKWRRDKSIVDIDKLSEITKDLIK